MEGNTFLDFLNSIEVNPVIASVGGLGAFLTLLVRGLHTLANTRQARRKEYLEQFLKPEIQANSLALEMLVKNCYGIRLPSDLIRRIQNSNFPSRILNGLSEFKEFFEINDAGSALEFSPFVLNRVRRFWMLIGISAVYAASVCTVGAVATGALGADQVSVGARWAIGTMFSVVGAVALEKGKVVSRAAKFIRIYSQEFQPDLLVSADGHARKPDETTALASSNGTQIART